MRHTKGRQKIEMKKVEAYANRVVTFSKRKSGILKKMNELASQCAVEMAFLVFSETGRPHTFAYPSLKEAFGRFKSLWSHEPVASDNMGALVEAYKRQKNQVLMQRYVDRIEEFEMENEKEKILEKSKKENKEKMWWITPMEGLSMKEIKWTQLQAFVDLHDSLSSLALKRFGNDGDGSSSSQEKCGGDGGTYA